MTLRNTRFIDACRGFPVDATPVWFVNQAGPHLPEYRALRDKYSLLEIYRTPELAAQMTTLPVSKLGVDVAVIFSDVSHIFDPLGISFELQDDGRTVVHDPIMTISQVENLRNIDSEDDVSHLVESIRIASRELDVPVIGIAGAPLALSGLLLQDRPHRTFARTRQFMQADENLWNALMERLTTAVIASLRAQANAGATALYIVDDIAGYLNTRSFEKFVAPHMKRLYIALTDLDVPIIYSAPKAPHLLRSISETGGHVIGVDWRIDIDEAWQTVGFDRSIQGNLDPATLLGEWEHVRDDAVDILNRAASVGQAGHIFNVGDAVLPSTPVDHLRRLVDLVHEHEPQRKPTRSRTLPARFPNPIHKPRQENGVLLMAYGSPTSLADMGPYYTHIRGGRPPKPELVADLVEAYRLIGGMSPLTPTTLSLAQKLENRLRIPVYVGMRHSEPFVADTLQQMATDGVKQAIAITLAPHYSKMSIGAYIKAAEAGLKEVKERGHALNLNYIESWSTHPFFIEMVTRRIRDAIRLITEASNVGTEAHPTRDNDEESLRLPDDAAVVFTAHSLPESIRKWNDPYEKDLENSCRQIAEYMGLDRWQLAYQSEGNTPDPWLGPDITEVIPQLASEGIRSVVVCPFGFVADHLEIYYDIDIEAETAAREAGVHLVRTESFNADQEFVELLHRLVMESGVIQV